MRLLTVSLFLFVFMAVSFYSCNPMPNGGVPFYMKMDSVTLNTKIEEGLNTQNITDVWVEANASNIGVYELPANFPVLLQNSVRFVVSAGVQESGQSMVRDIYPFYQPDTFSITATLAAQYHHKPVFRYKTGTYFPFVPEDFESGIDYTGMAYCDTGITLERNGHKCGVITVTATSDSNILATQLQKFPLTVNHEAWLEIDYKCDVPFNIGCFAFSGTSVTPLPLLFVSARSHWNKLYVKMTDAVAAYPADNYLLYFEALRPYGSGGGNVFLDNIKVVTF